MNVLQLNPEQLDYWVAQAKGLALHRGDSGEWFYIADPTLPPRKWKPTTFWSQGGPIIEEARIDLNWDTEGNGQWSASIEPDILVQDQSLLKAAMRAYVVARLGQELPPGAE